MQAQPKNNAVWRRRIARLANKKSTTMAQLWRWMWRAFAPPSRGLFSHLRDEIIRRQKISYQEGL